MRIPASGGVFIRTARLCYIANIPRLQFIRCARYQVLRADESIFPIFARLNEQVKGNFVRQGIQICGKLSDSFLLLNEYHSRLLSLVNLNAFFPSSIVIVVPPVAPAGMARIARKLSSSSRKG